MKQFTLLFIAIIGFSFSGPFAQNALPPRNIVADPMSLHVTFDVPRFVLLKENFEWPQFPPNGWSSFSSCNIGWFRSSNGGSPGFIIPPHSTYAVSNDDLAGPSASSCDDELRTRPLYLAGNTGYHVRFNSFFTGNKNQMAFLFLESENYSLLVNEITGSNEWTNFNLSLSSNTVLQDSLKLVFITSDNGGLGSGWAIDDIEVYTEELAVCGYVIYVNNYLFDSVPEPNFTIPASLASFGDNVHLKIGAKYPGGEVAYDSIEFVSQYLYPPADFIAITTGDSLRLSWNYPFDSTGLMSYRLYVDDILIDQIPKESLSATYYNSDPGVLSYCLTAVYNLSFLGTQGTGESAKVCISDSIVSMPCLPFVENWDSSSFGQNGWYYDDNWQVVMTNTSGTNNPAVMFSGTPPLFNYINSLESVYLDNRNDQNEIDCKVYLDFCISLNSPVLSQTELLKVDVYSEGHWSTIIALRNDSIYNQHRIKYDITGLAKNKIFKFRFLAEGTNSAYFIGWTIDSISCYKKYVLKPPEHLTVEKEWGTYVLNWKPPVFFDTKEYKLDDGSFETGVYLNGFGEIWLGHEFATNDHGELNKAEIFLSQNFSGTTYSIDVFDAGKNFIGTSGTFVPMLDAWTTVPLPEIPFNGTFFIMVHLFSVIASDIFPLDTNGPNAASNPEWLFDGVSWNKISNFGFPPSILAIRAHAFSDNKKSEFMISYNKNHPTINHAVNLDLDRCAVNMAPKNPSVATGNNCNSGSWLKGYKIFHRTWFNPNFSGEFHLIATVDSVTTSFVHNDLLLNSCNQYYVVAVYNVGESSASNLGHYCYTGLPDKNPGFISLYPNPVSTILNIEIKKNYSQLRMYSANGQLIKNLNLSSIKSLETDMSHLPSGIYSLVFLDDSGETTYLKVIVNH